MTIQDEWEEEDEEIVGRAEKEREARIKLTAKVSPGWFPKVGKQTFFLQIRKFFGSFRYRQSAKFLFVPVRKSQKD